MSLEDFFTLAEMNNGLTSPARVKELVTVMQKETDCVVKSIGDATRQWSAVVSVIAGTESQECLDLFIQLDGLCYLNIWLKNAGTFGDKSRDGFLEDSITDLLRALQRLQLDYDKSNSSGIWMTVQNLLGHNSFKVQDMAKALLSSWNQENENNATPHGIENIETLVNEGTGVNAEHVGECDGPVSSFRDINACMESLVASNLASIDSESLEAERINDAKERSLKDAIMNEEKSHSIDSKDATLTETCFSAGLVQSLRQEQSANPDIVSTDDVKKIQKTGSSPERSDKVEVSKSTSTIDAKDILKSATEPPTLRGSDAVELEYDEKITSFDGTRTVVSEPNCRMGDNISSSYCRSSIVSGIKENDGSNSDVLQESNTSELKLDKLKGSCSLLLRNANDGAVEGVDEKNSDQHEGGLCKHYDLSKPKVHSTDRLMDKKSNLEMDYGTINPLVVAQQVVLEVETEVKDCKQPSCRSFEKEFGSKVQQPQNLHSVTGKQCQTGESKPVETSAGLDLSVDSQIREDPATSARNQEADPLSVTHNGESSQLTGAAQVVDDTEKGPSHFDLNQEVLYEDMDLLGDCTSSPISVVSASRMAAAPGMPFAPPQFEGTLGWKGSAATSAFQPASPRRVPENDVALSAGVSNSSSKQNHCFVNFDLNVAESGEDRIADVQTWKQIPMSSRFASVETSAEASPRRSEGFELDLNRVSDDGDAPSAWQPERDLLNQRNGHHQQSPPSSSSQQSSLRNIDLNDQPPLANNAFSNHCYGKSSQTCSAFGGIKPDESVISIMGMRVKVNQKDSSAQFLPLPNGRVLEPATDVNMARNASVFEIGSPVPYSHPLVYGYNDFSSGPALPFSLPVYGQCGPIPYMVVPQIMGSSSSLPIAFQQTPYMLGMTGPPGSNGVGPLCDNFDLNLGSILEGSNRESRGFRQLFSPGQSMSIDEPLKSDLQLHTSSGSTGKRKEPDGGWDPCPFLHHSQPWRQRVDKQDPVLLDLI